MVVHQWLRLMTSKKLCVSTEVVVIMCTLSPSNEAQMVSKFQPDMYSLEISPRLFNKCVVINYCAAHADPDNNGLSGLFRAQFLHSAGKKFGQL